jgi:hypothetical protein
MKTLNKNKSIDEILKTIVDHFGSIRRFNLLAGRSEFDLYYLKKQEIKKQGKLRDVKLRIIADFEKYKNESLFLKPNDLELIQSAIFTNYRTPANFCRKNPQFTQPWISRLLHGEYTKVTKKIKELFVLLELDI